MAVLRNDPKPGPKLVDENGETNCWLASAYSAEDVRDEFEHGGELHEVWFRPRWTSVEESADEGLLYDLFGDHEMNGVDTTVVYDRAKSGSPGAHRYWTTEPRWL
jgi:hypothetical protein